MISEHQPLSTILRVARTPRFQRLESSLDHLKSKQYGIYPEPSWFTIKIRFVLTSWKGKCLFLSIAIISHKGICTIAMKNIVQPMTIAGRNILEDFVLFSLNISSCKWLTVSWFRVEWFVILQWLEFNDCVQEDDKENAWGDDAPTDPPEYRQPSIYHKFDVVQEVIETWNWFQLSRNILLISN